MSSAAPNPHAAALIDFAIDRAGGAATVARKRGLRSPWSVRKWKVDGLPAAHVLWLAAETAFAVTPHQLAPHLYPNPTDGLPPAPADAKAEAAE